MKYLLHITSSLFGENGKSTLLSTELVEQLKQQHPGLEVINRSLQPEDVPYLDANIFGAFITPAEEQTAEQKSAVALSDQLIAEWRQADCVVIGLPMYNLGVPSSFKSYIDHITRAGETFRYTETGPVGLLKDRPVYVVTARGGQYQGTPLDTQTPYVQHILGLLGISSIRFFHTEGLNMGEEVAEKAIQQTRDALQEEFA